MIFIACGIVLYVYDSSCVMFMVYAAQLMRLCTCTQFICGPIILYFATSARVRIRMLAQTHTYTERETHTRTHKRAGCCAAAFYETNVQAHTNTHTRTDTHAREQAQPRA